MSKLERRYTRWATLFYPAHYRHARGTELVGTYLALAAPGRQRPSAADVADLAAGGLQQHLRITKGLRPGFGIAGLLALMTATAFAAGWTIFDLLRPTPPRPSPLQPFVTLGAAAWAAWLLAAVVYLAAPGRGFRWATGVAVLTTAGVVPAAMLTGLPRPPLSVLLPQLVLGVVAFGASGWRSWWARAMPLAAGAASVPLAVDIATVPDFFGDYYTVAAEALPSAAGLLLISVMLLALGWAALRDYRGVWALLLLLTPIGMLALSPLGALLDDTGFGQPIIPTWPSMVLASVLVAVGGPALVVLVLAIATRRQPSATTSP
ncbi:hypothetical protein AB0F72_19500 [Actinoplanes sp. NPDC023936]|uniref:hypothetical protein n=1 Tax=Actinoplanes sp. NPDC023936 TaxID=3154910 RepID=UPI0033CDA471